MTILTIFTIIDYFPEKGTYPYDPLNEGKITPIDGYFKVEDWVLQYNNCYWVLKYNNCYGVSSSEMSSDLFDFSEINLRCYVEEYPIKSIKINKEIGHGHLAYDCYWGNGKFINISYEDGIERYINDYNKMFLGTLSLTGNDFYCLLDPICNVS